jgi:hypothetical protein
MIAKALSWINSSAITYIPLHIFINTSFSGLEFRGAEPPSLTVDVNGMAPGSRVFHREDNHSMNVTMSNSSSVGFVIRYGLTRDECSHDSHS